MMEKNMKGAVAAMFCCLILHPALAAPETKHGADYVVYVGAWGACAPVPRSIPDLPINSAPGLTFEPRVGEQTRDVKCRDTYGVLVDLSYCMAEKRVVPSTRRACIVAEACSLGAWGSWRAADHCSSGLPGLMVRTRPVQSLPQGNGKPCGPLEERNLTEASDDLLRWVSSPWGACHLPTEHHDLLLPPLLGSSLDEGGLGEDTAGRCGGGLQRRALNCINRLHSATLPDRACSALPPPLTVQRCEVACPRDCVVGEWSTWGPCEPLSGCPMTPVEELTSNGYRRRSRRVLVAASSEGAPCGALTEVQACGRPACARWTPSTWGSCRTPSEPRASCGSGLRERSVTCTDLQGAPLPDEQCLGSGPKPTNTESCQVACPLDCVVSSWSPWSSCSHACSTRHQRAMRSRNRTIIAPPGEGGHPCPPPEALVQMEPCNTHGCHGYSWLTLPWQACGAPTLSRDLPEGDGNEVDQPPIGSLAETPENVYIDQESSNSVNCGPGLLQTREVWCMENNDRRVKDSHCAPMKKPESWRPCTRACPKPCSLTPWSAWSPCPTTCEGGVQQRQRSFRPGSGSECGALRERRACPIHPIPPPAHWSHGAWSPCQLPRGAKCGQGLMTRGVWCSLQHHKVPPASCVVHGPPPPMHLRCTVDCSSRCQLSDWSPWSRCHAQCTGVSTRSRKKLGNSPCPNTVLYEGHECPCGSFHAQLVGTWSSCIVQDAPAKIETPSPMDLVDTPAGSWDVRESIIEGGRQQQQGCGVGARFRRVACLDATGRAVEPHWCEPHVEGLETGTVLGGLVRETCAVACPVDCRMSQWSAWGACDGAPCGVSLQKRTRNILVNASAGGRPCGVTSQTKVCMKPCEQYGWVAGGWSSCQLIPRHRPQGCGTGDQYRTVRCAEISTGGTVADALCDPQQQPADLNACHVPCPGECVVSEWSEWSQCPKSCSQRTQRDRTRALLRAAARVLPGWRSAESCPPLVQAQPCLLNRTCFTHTWRTAPWGACLPLGGSPCGEGMQQRAIYCERSDGRQVHNSFCDSSSRPVEPTDKFCYVDCPIDCEVSEWSSWDTSACTCGVHTNNLDYITRTRRILTEASTSGRPCPQNLLEQVSCPLTPCYLLHKSPYTHCQLDQGATCGYGTRYRNVTCVRETDEEEVSASLCSPHLNIWEITQKEESCYVDCNDDCRHSPWSRWSACDTEGVRYRKRVSFKPPGPPCLENVLRYEVFEYANCNVTESELNRDISEWNTYDEPVATQEQDDYYVNDQPEKTYLLFTAGKKVPDEHTALAVGIASASLVVMLLLLYLTVRCHKQRTIHKV